MNYSRLQYNWKNMDNGTVQMEHGIIGEIMDNGTVRMEHGLIGEIMDNGIIPMIQWKNGTLNDEDNGETTDNGTVPTKHGIIGETMDNGTVQLKQQNNGTVQLKQQNNGLIGEIMDSGIIPMIQSKNIQQINQLAIGQKNQHLNHLNLNLCQRTFKSLLAS